MSVYYAVVLLSWNMGMLGSFACTYGSQNAIEMCTRSVVDNLTEFVLHNTKNTFIIGSPCVCYLKVDTGDENAVDMNFEGIDYKDCGTTIKVDHIAFGCKSGYFDWNFSGFTRIEFKQISSTFTLDWCLKFSFKSGVRNSTFSITCYEANDTVPAGLETSTLTLSSLEPLTLTPTMIYTQSFSGASTIEPTSTEAWVTTGAPATTEAPTTTEASTPTEISTTTEASSIPEASTTTEAPTTTTASKNTEAQTTTYAKTAIVGAAGWAISAVELVFIIVLVTVLIRYRRAAKHKEALTEATMKNPNYDTLVQGPYEDDLLEEKKHTYSSVSDVNMTMTAM